MVPTRTLGATPRAATLSAPLLPLSRRLPMSAEPLPNPEKVLRYSFAYAPPLMIEAAVRLKVFDALAAGPRTAEDVAKQLGASHRGLRILMNGLVGLELLTKPHAGHYALTPEA